MGGNESGEDTLTTAEYWRKQRKAFYLMYGLCWIGLLIGGAAVLHTSYPLATASIGVLFTGILGMGFLIGGAEHDYWEHVRRGKIEDPGADARKSIFRAYDGEKKTDRFEERSAAEGDSDQ